MYTGSAEFQAANSQPIQKHKISGTIDGVPFGPENVLFGSVNISNQCSDSVDAQIGAVYIGTLNITFLPNVGIEPTTWQGREIVVNFSLLIEEQPETWETFSLGVFTVADAERNMQGFEITAYDNMSKFDKSITWDYLPAGTLYSILSDICANCGVNLGMNQADCEALPNGDWPNIAMYPGSTVQTYRDILYWLSQMVAGFATCDRQGRLVLKSYKTILSQPGAVPVLPQDKRLAGASISDYVTNFRGVTLYSMKEETSKYYGPPVGTGIVYDLGENPFMQYGTAATIRDMTMEIVDAIGYHLRPFDASIMCAPIFELGDRLKLSGGIAEGYNNTTVIHAIHYAHGRNTQLQCFGANPSILASGTQDKTASTAGNSAKQQTTSYKRYANPNAVSIGSAQELVTEITFTAEKNTDFDVWHEFLIETQLDPGSDSMTLEAVYYLDGAELVRKPVETYTDSARHILTLNYSESVAEGNHMWQVYLEASGGTASIDTNNGIAVLKGQGLSNAEAWDGIIYLVDDVHYMDIIMHVSTVAETSLSLETADCDVITLSDSVPSMEMTMEPAPISENYTFTLFQPAFPIEAEESTAVLAMETTDEYIETE